MGFGFPVAGHKPAAAAAGPLNSPDVAQIALAFQARVPEKTRNRRGSALIGGYRAHFSREQVKSRVPLHHLAT